MEGVSNGQGPIPDRDTPADGAPDRRAGVGARGEPGWLYKLLARYRREGWAGLEPRSRRPRPSPYCIADLYEDEIVRIRKELIDSGFDAGAETIHFHMATPVARCPSPSTIYRVLRARGFVTPEPHKRPKSSWTRFVAEFPNECWQADVTHVEAADGVVYEVLNIIDDHSRVCVASKMFVTTHAPDVVRTLHKAAATWGYPQRLFRQRAHLHVAAGIGRRSLRSRAVESGHRHEAWQALPPPDPRQGGTLPPDPRSTSPSRTRRHQEAAPGSAQPIRRLLQHRATSSRHRTPPADRGVERPREGGTDRSADRGGGLSDPPRQSGPRGSVTLVTRASCTTSEWGAPMRVGGSSCRWPASTCRSWASTAHRSGT